VYIGYGRLSLDQNASRLEALKEQLQNAGAERVFVEQTSVAGPFTERNAALAHCVKGDVLIVQMPIQLAQSVSELLEIAYGLEEKGAVLSIQAIGVSTDTVLGRTMIRTMQVMLQFQRDAARERQIESVAKAKAAGKYRGRMPTAGEKAAQVLDLARRGVTREDIAQRLGIGVATVYRLLRRAKSEPTGGQGEAPE